jgi:hypothetical protein
VAPSPAADSRPAQAERAADFMEAHPEGVTAAELEAACDLGSVTKVLSEMVRRLGYRIARTWRRVPCRYSRATRRRRVYLLVSRPTPPRQLALPLD